MNEITLSVVIYSIVLIFCLSLVKKLNRRHFDYFDPGFLFLMFASLTFLPLAFLIIFWYNITDFFPHLNMADLELFRKTVIAHTVLISSFTAGYFLFSRRARIKEYQGTHKIWFSKVWILIAALFIVFEFLIRHFNPSGLIAHYTLFFAGWLRDIAEMIALGVILCHFNSKKKAFIFLLVFAIIYMFLSNIIFRHGDVIEINRGHTFAISFAALCYLDMVKWKGRLLNFRTLSILVLLALIGLYASEFFERVVISGDPMPSLSMIGANIALSFEPIIFENAATIISWIDTGSIDPENGRTYLLALEGLKPFGHFYQSMAEWYVWERNVDYAIAGGGYNFSAVAEGYLNGGYFGVLVQGFFLSISATLLLYFKHSKSLGIYRPFFYAPFLLLVFAFNRKEMKAIINQAEYMFFSIALLIFIYLVLTRTGVNPKKNLVKAPAL